MKIITKKFPMEHNKKLMGCGFPNLKRYIYNTTPVLKAKGTLRKMRQKSHRAKKSAVRLGLLEMCE